MPSAKQSHERKSWEAAFKQPVLADIHTRRCSSKASAFSTSMHTIQHKVAQLGLRAHAAFREDSPESSCGKQPQVAWPISLLLSRPACEPVCVKSPAPCCNTCRGRLDTPQAKGSACSLRRHQHPRAHPSLSVPPLGDICQGSSAGR